MINKKKKILLLVFILFLSSIWFFTVKNYKKNTVEITVSLNELDKTKFENWFLNLTTSEIGIYIVEEKTQKKLSEISVAIYNTLTDKLIETVITDINGYAKFNNLPKRQNYKLVISNLYTETIEKNIVLLDKEISISIKPKSYIKKYSVTEEGVLNIDKININVPVILQKPELPNGCEITAFTALINYNDVKIEHSVMSDDYLEKELFYYKNGEKYGPDPNVAFAGNPREKSGWYVFEDPIINAGNKLFIERNIKKEIIKVSGSSSLELKKYLDQGLPIVIWTTLDYTKPRYGSGWKFKNDIKYEAIKNLHSVVIIGYDEYNFNIMDPLKGFVTVEKKLFFETYVEMGKRAIIIK